MYFDWSDAVACSVAFMDMHSPYGTDWRNEDDNYLQIQDDRETVGNEGGTLFTRHGVSQLMLELEAALGSASGSR